MNDFVKKYVPENLRYEDSEQTVETIFTKIVTLFEDVLDGDVLSGSQPGQIDSNWLKEVDELYTYWDVIRNDYKQKVRTLIDPHDLSGIITDDNDALGRLLYFLSNIYSIKGTEKAFRYVLRLVGMDAEAIQWYKPEYLDYLPEVETCHSILKIRIGNRPLTDEMVELFDKLVSILLDVCFTVSLWIYVKNLTDDVPCFDQDLKLFASHCKGDRYSHCGFEINDRGLKGKYGVYGCPSILYRWNIVGFPHDYYKYDLRAFKHKIYEDCPKFHNYKWRYSPALSFYEHDIACDCGVEDLPYLTHILDPMLRHGDPIDLGPCVFHNHTYQYNQRFDLWEGYYECLPDGNIRPCGDQSIPYPRRLGEKEIAQSFDGLDPLMEPFCKIDPYTFTVFDSFVDTISFSSGHDGAIKHDCYIYHTCGSIDTLVTYSFENFVDSYNLLLEASDREKSSGYLEQFVDQVDFSFLHDNKYKHSHQYETDQWMFYNKGFIQEKLGMTSSVSLLDNSIIKSSDNRVFHNGSYFHDGADWTTAGVINVHGSTSRLANTIYNSRVCHSSSDRFAVTETIKYDTKGDTFFATTHIPGLDHNNSWIHSRALHTGDIVLNPGEDWEIREIWDELQCVLPEENIMFNFIDPTYVPPPQRAVNFGQMPTSLSFNFTDSGYTVNPDEVDFEV